MNCNFRSLWNESTGTFVAVSEIASSAGKKTSSGMRSPGTGVHFCLQTLAACVLLSLGATVYALPTGGAVVAGAASISSGALSTTINQSTQNAAINWQSFNIATGEAVRVLQPNSSSVLLNRVLGSDPSNILGSLTANGKVFLVNPNGILFGRGASVNTAGLVASTLNVTDSDFMAGRYQFAGNSTASVLNQGSIQADGGYVALLGANVTNGGVIQARLGSVALAAGSAMTLDVAGDGLLHVSVSQGALNALAQNGGLIQADGGQVLLSAQSAGALLQSAVNNTGVIQAQTIENHQGMIRLLGDMQSGTLNVGGTLDAGAPKGGSGGLVETSAAHVNISDSTSVTTRSAQGSSGHWLIDPADFTIAASGGNISGSTLLDHWALGMLFPIVPIHRLDERPTLNSTLVDITCDSDGKVNKFIDRKTDMASTLALHEIGAGSHGNAPYYLGVFLTGAYQDIMGDIHNLFGRVNEVHVFLDEDEECGYYLEETIAGNTIGEVLRMTQYEERELAARLKSQVDAAIKQDKLKPTEGVRLVNEYERGMKDQTYLSW